MKLLHDRAEQYFGFRVESSRTMSEYFCVKVIERCADAGALLIGMAWRQHLKGLRDLRAALNAPNDRKLVS